MKMNDNGITIRRTRPEDHVQTENLCREAFWNVYRPGCLEHYVLHCLRENAAFVPELDHVMEYEGKLIGLNVFVRSVIRTDSGPDLPVMTMGPFCILPEFQHLGYGRMLLEYTLDRAAASGCPAVCFEGNINFYGKCGCVCARQFGLRYRGLPDGADDSFFLCRVFRTGYFDGMTGEYATPDVYLVDEKAADLFDQAFPHKEKLKLPGQLF